MKTIYGVESKAIAQQSFLLFPPESIFAFLF